ncbi:DUF771 domain-containing protein [Carnobacterium divergens]|uniref:DUF771 domain-containing protein n=1 Tax=Carnobacterium divergens TaxID=2748 RepID=UPI0007F35C27|nr:DUF771 domain-containing protein [Carnobacterium divergens]SBO16277.1 phage protein [Carnobacterium divergens]
MVQILEVSVPIQIPENFVLVEKNEYQKLKENELLGSTWDMKDLRSKLKNMSSSSIKSKLLYPNQKLLDVKNGGFVKYPSGRGSDWRFGALKMANYIEENWSELMTKEDAISSNNKSKIAK